MFVSISPSAVERHRRCRSSIFPLVSAFHSSCRTRIVFLGHSIVVRRPRRSSRQQRSASLPRRPNTQRTLCAARRRTASSVTDFFRSDDGTSKPVQHRCQPGCSARWKWVFCVCEWCFTIALFYLFVYFISKKIVEIVPKIWMQLQEWTITKELV